LKGIPNRETSYGEGYVAWTSPVAGVVRISGNTWYLGGLVRSDDWTLSLNGTTLASGTVGYGDGHTRDNPYTFGSFTENIEVGDQIIFTAVRNPSSTYPYFLGVNLTIEAVPLPGALWLLGSGLLGLGAWRRFRG